MHLFFRIGIRFQLLILLVSCQRQPVETPPELTVYIAAPHLDYSSTDALLYSLSQRPRLEGIFGHVWIRLKGPQGTLVGGHSGEIDSTQPRYFDGVMDLVDANRPNPVSYLATLRNDGFFQYGSGGHRPTSRHTFSLTQEQYHRLLKTISSYDFSHYALSNHQCCTFATTLLTSLNINTDTTLTLPLAKEIHFGGCPITLWHDPTYSTFTFASPDKLERSLLINPQCHSFTR
ncbi:MAG: hypothetical protein KDK65_00500 [Chlamydiia bacterium]|nr:hypothetical protein [Chlamydiia bacterium]